MSWIREGWCVAEQGEVVGGDVVCHGVEVGGVVGQGGLGEVLCVLDGGSRMR